MKRRILVSAGVSAFVVTAAALAFFLVGSSFEGSGEATLGKGSAVVLPATVTLGPGLVPGKLEPVIISLENKTGPTVHIKAIKAVVTAAPAGCEAKWFSLKILNLEWQEVLEGKKAEVLLPGLEVKAATLYNFSEKVGGVEVLFKEEAVSQSACEGGSLKIAVTVTGS